MAQRTIKISGNAYRALTPSQRKRKSRWAIWCLPWSSLRSVPTRTQICMASSMMQRAKESSANSFSASNKSFIYIKSILYIMEMKKEINWEQVAEERRAKVLWFSSREIFNSLVLRSQGQGQEPTQIIRVPLPQSYRLRDVYHDQLRDSFGFIILSPEFPPSAIGSELPSLSQAERQIVPIDLRNQKVRKNEWTRRLPLLWRHGTNLSLHYLYIRSPMLWWCFRYLHSYKMPTMRGDRESR